MPVWHVSVSLVAPSTGRRRNRERDVEAHAIRALAGVGGNTEWWYWSPARIGHLRVALTSDEAAQLPPWHGPIDDAGAEGVRRPRRRSR